MTSERAAYRQRDLRGLTITRLRDHVDLIDLLAQVGADESNIVPSFLQKQWHNPAVGSAQPPDAAIAVMVVTGSSERANLQERVNLTVQVELEFRATVNPAIGTQPWADAVVDEISAVMTTQVADWEVEGETGGTPEPLWNEDRNRYVAVKRFDISRYG